MIQIVQRTALSHHDSNTHSLKVFSQVGQYSTDFWKAE